MRIKGLLEIAFGEDESRIRKDHAPENFAMLHHINSLRGLKNVKEAAPMADFLLGEVAHA